MRSGRSLRRPSCAIDGLAYKAAALCAEQSTDPIVLDTVSDIEVLATGMSRKIWQAISLAHLVQQPPQPGPLT